MTDITPEIRLAGGYYNANNDWVNVGSGPGGGGSNQVPQSPFTTQWWTDQRATQMAALQPYYDQKLSLAKGDVELAKKYIEEDYQRGVRQATDTFNTENTYLQGEQTGQNAQENLSNSQTVRENEGKANNAGVYTGEMKPDQPAGSPAPQSQFYQSYIGGPEEQAHQLRLQAIQRAIQKQQDTAGIAKTQALGDPTTGDEGSLQQTRSQGESQQDQSFRNYQLTANQEQQDKAVTNTQNQYNADYSAWKASNPTGL